MIFNVVKYNYMYVQKTCVVRAAGVGVHRFVKYTLISYVYSKKFYFSHIFQLAD